MPSCNDDDNNDYYCLPSRIVQTHLFQISVDALLNLPCLTVKTPQVHVLLFHCNVFLVTEVKKSEFEEKDGSAALLITVSFRSVLKLIRTS